MEEIFPAQSFSKSQGHKKSIFAAAGVIITGMLLGLVISYLGNIQYGAPDPLDPKSAYGIGKRMAEHLCALYSDSSFETKIARCFAFVGPYLPLDIHFAIGNFIRDGLKGGPIIVKGNGTPYRSYLYAADLAIWLWTILFKGQNQHPYNVGSNESLSISEVAQRVAEQFSTKTTVEIRDASNPQKVLELYVPDIQRAKNELDLQVWVGLNDGIRRSLQNVGSA